MQTNLCLRWHHKTNRFAPAGARVNPTEYEVSEIRSDNEAKPFITAHHYSGSYPAARFRFGMYHRITGLVGVAVFSHPVNQAVLTKTFPGEPLESVELGRFVLLDQVPGNGESWFLGECFRRLRALGLLGVVSFSDPVARTNQKGEKIFPGHVGTIYQATNATYLGRGTARTLRMLPDGTVFSERAASKIRSQEVGTQYAEAQLVAAGAIERGTENPKVWLSRWLPLITRPLRHPGNHRYAWVLPRRHKGCLPSSLPYPKFLTA